MPPKNSAPSPPPDDLGEVPARSFAEAERRIAQAVKKGATDLDLSIKGLAAIPSVIGLPALRSLTLESTNVTDLAPLSILTALQSLNLDYTQITDLAPLANLASLQSLSLHNSQILDIAPIAGFSALNSLDLDSTKVSDLAPLTTLTMLQTLGLRFTSVSDLRPIANIVALQSLNIMGTEVSDLGPLSGLVNLETLNARFAKISDLMPLSALKNLRLLNLSDTAVSDLMPLSRLTALRSLNISSTDVDDLTPLANLVHLIDEARHGNWNGLIFAKCLLTDKIVQDFAGLDNPQRTIKTINYLREQQGLPPYDDKGDLAADANQIDDVPDTDDNEPRVLPPPTLPAQGPGPHFALQTDGVIDFVLPETLDRAGNNVARLRKLHAPLAEAVRDFLGSLGGDSNNLYPQLVRSC